MTKRDRGYKLLFSHAEMVRDLLTGFVQGDWVPRLDFSTLALVDKSLLGEELASRESDLIWKVRFGDEWLFVYLLLEFQTRVDRLMALRVMAYVALFYQGLVRAGQVKTRELLPPILPIVLYSGERRWRAATDVADLVTKVPGDLERYTPHLAYLLLDQGALAESAAAIDRNLAAALFRLEQSPDVSAIVEMTRQLAAWLRESGNDALLRSWVTVAKEITGEDCLGDLTEEPPMLEKRVKEWKRQLRHEAREEGLQEGRQAGRKEGRQEGRQEGEAEGLRKGEAEGERKGKAELLTRLVEHKFGRLDAMTRARINDASVPDLQRFADRVLDAQTLQDVFSS